MTLSTATQSALSARTRLLIVIALLGSVSSCCLLTECCQVKQPQDVAEDERVISLDIGADLSVFADGADLGEGELTVKFEKKAKDTFTKLDQKSAVFYMLTQTIICLKARGASDEIIKALIATLDRAFQDALGSAGPRDSDVILSDDSRTRLRLTKDGQAALSILDPMLLSMEP